MSAKTHSTFWTLIALSVLGPYIYLFSHDGLFKKLAPLALETPYFWIILVIVAGGIALYKHYSENSEFTWREYTLVPFLSAISIFGIVMLLFFFATDLYDTEVWNDKVQSAVFYEEYTTETCTEDEDGDEDCTTTYHPPEWKICTKGGDVVSTSRTVYERYVQLFGNEEEKFVYHANQVSIGDGNKFVTVYDGSKEKLVPTAIEHPYVNYIKASESILRLHGDVMKYDEDLASYPRVYSDYYGEIYLDRVIHPNLNIRSYWVNKLNTLLCESLSDLGGEKEVNILVYLTGRDQDIYYALHQLWVGGKKNDVVVLVGTNENLDVDWVRIMSWTDSEEFKVGLRDRIYDMKTLTDAESFAQIILDEVQDTYVRKPMEEFEYLKTDIDFPFWAIVIGIVLGILSQAILVIYFTIN